VQEFAYNSQGITYKVRVLFQLLMSF